MRVAIANPKGECGKTLTSVFLAGALAGRGRTLLVDTEPQGSALSWAREAAAATAPAVAAPERKQKTVKLIMDLDVIRHRRLKEFAFGEDVKNAEVMRALLDELDADPEFASRSREWLSRVRERRG